MPDGSHPARDPVVCAACGGAGADAARAEDEAMLRRMAEFVLEVAEMVRDEARAAHAVAVASPQGAEPGAAPARRLAPTDYGLTLSRLSRSLRLTLALKRRFADQAAAFAAQARARTDAVAAEAARKAEFAQSYRGWTREQKHEAIQIAAAMAAEQLTERGAGEAEREALFADLNERVDDDSDLDAIGEYSLVDLVVLLCARHGLAFDPADVQHDDEVLRTDWLDDLPEPPPKPPNHPGWT